MIRKNVDIMVEIKKEKNDSANKLQSYMYLFLFSKLQNSICPIYDQRLLNAFSQRSRLQSEY